MLKFKAPMNISCIPRTLDLSFEFNLLIKTRYEFHLRVVPKNSPSLDQGKKKKKSRQGPTDTECQPIFEYPPISDNIHPSLFTYQNQTLSEIRSRIRLRLDVNHFYELSVLVIGSAFKRRSNDDQRPRFYLRNMPAFQQQISS